MLREAAYYSRMAAGIFRYVRAPRTPDPIAKIRAQVENRAAAFLQTVEKAVFSDPSHPYTEMFRLAGCTHGDLTTAVRRNGLEATLEQLHADGVCLDHDEFKGVKPIVRSGRHIATSPHSFRNPLVRGLLESSSGASRSLGTQTPRSVADLLVREDQEMLRRTEFALHARSLIEVRPVLPSTTGLNPSMRMSRFGQPVERWFVPGGTWRSAAHYRVATYGLVAWANISGASVPVPQQLPPNDFSPVVDYVQARIASGRACAVGTNVSAAVRIIRTAVERGFDISGTLFLLHGEPLSDSKAAFIAESGCHAISHYAISEIGIIGSGCREMVNRNCAHLFSDSVAAIVVPRPSPFFGSQVNSLLFTTLYATAPHLFINADMHDCGVIEQARCDCTYSNIGFTLQVHDIYSYGKLTGFGMTLAAGDVLRLIEDILPRRFGGLPGDCQLAESEDLSGTRMSLRISPRLKIESPEAAKQVFLNELKHIYGGSLAARTWEHAAAVEVVSAEPYATRGGKILPLYLIREKAQNAHAS